MKQAVARGPVEQDFTAAMRQLPSAVAVLTVMTDTGPMGMTAGTVTRVSTDPGMLSVRLRSGSRLATAVTGFGGFAVNLLQGHQCDIARWFSSSERFRAADEFEGIAWQAAPGGGHPMLPDAACVLECRTAASVPGGDHIVVIGRVEYCRVRTAASPLLSYRGRFHTLAGGPAGEGAPAGRGGVSPG